MDKSYYYLNEIKFTKDDKIFIGIGDSFCAGTGTESTDLWESQNWEIPKMRVHYDAIAQGYENSFVNQICKKHLKDYKPINLSMAGKGNKFAIRELFLNPYLNMENAAEKIVVYVASGLERFDVCADIADRYQHSHTIWPYYDDPDQHGYGDIYFDDVSICNDAFLAGEFVMDMYMLNSWCEINNAKLLFIDGFSERINRAKMIELLINGRDESNTHKATLNLVINNACDLVNKIPWHRQIKPMGYETIMQMLLHLQGRDDLIGLHKFREYQVNKHATDDFISKCQHPTKKSHEMLADIIYQHILEYDNVEKPDYGFIDRKKYYLKTII